MKYSVSGKLINVPNHLDTLDTVGSPQPEATSLAARADRYRNEVEQVVRNVGEHPQYELKRSYDLSNLHQRMEFVKDIQAIATSQIDSEKFLVIGADEATRQFVAVTNVQEFDEARVRQQLERYLSPVPRFEIFHLRTADTVPFVLIVLGKQPTRRILARATVDDQTEMKPRLLLREGDLWTKGDSTGKRLARPEDWDAIYEEAIERETETRTRARTDHVVQQVVAQERIRAVSGGSFVFPAYLADEEFNVVVEEICARGDRARLAILLERLRDDLIEGWHKQGAYDKGLFQADPGTIPAFQEASRIQRDGVFRPAMRRLTMLCNSIVKFRGSIPLFETSLELIRETFNTSHRLHALRLSHSSGDSIRQSGRSFEPHACRVGEPGRGLHNWSISR